MRIKVIPSFLQSSAKLSKLLLQIKRLSLTQLLKIICLFIRKFAFFLITSSEQIS
jgi:hypothetical protein